MREYFHSVIWQMWPKPSDSQGRRRGKILANRQLRKNKHWKQTAFRNKSRFHRTSWEFISEQKKPSTSRVFSCVIITWPGDEGTGTTRKEGCFVFLHKHQPSLLLQRVEPSCEAGQADRQRHSSFHLRLRSTGERPEKLGNAVADHFCT